nr:flagellar basal body-associated FliL family protein [Frigidibacter sp. ROC022]
MLLPLVLALAGLGAGLGAGIALKPAPQVAADPCGEPQPGTRPPEPVELEHDYVKLNNQFIVPVLKEGRIESLVVLTLSLEVVKGGQEQIYAREPKLRDAFLRVLIDHANSGGFDGTFTSNGNMTHLREALNNAAQMVVKDVVTEVLIVDIVRQDQ